MEFLTKPFYSEFEGKRDERGLRIDYGSEIWRTNEESQTYAGNYFLDSYHTYGLYKWNENYNKVSYEGTFYANAKEGYGLISYSDGSTFEGLFLNDRRYGPGVLTHANGRQDVGLWIGGQIVRLIKPVIAVPKLACSPEAQVKILHFRTLIDMMQETEDIASKILKDLDAPEELLMQSNKLYSDYIRNPNSVFFNKQSFDKRFFTTYKKIQDIHIEKLDKQNGDLNDQEQIKEDLNKNEDFKLIAWNNEEHIIGIMKHSYKYNEFEENVSLNVEELLQGNREYFNTQGIIEAMYTLLLSESAEKDKRIIRDSICSYHLYPSVADSFGNTTVMIAAANDRWEIIKELVTVGANVDAVNDESLTPLNLCLLRFLAIHYDIQDWENAFLPPFPALKNGTEWRAVSYNVFMDRDTTVSDSQGTIGTGLKVVKSKRQIDIPTTQKYLFQFDVPTEASNEKKTRKQNNIPSKQKAEKPEPTNIARPSNGETSEDDRTLGVQNTIMTLLELGADPSLSNVPHPALYLAIFTQNPLIVEELLKAGANPQLVVPYEDDGLTLMHAVCLLPPDERNVQILQLLLEYGADPNALTTPAWFEKNGAKWQLGIFSAEFEKETSLTPLQMLCLRPDLKFSPLKGELYKMITLLASVTNPEITFQGHTPLSTIALREEDELIHLLLEAGFSPNAKLADDLGTPLILLMNRESFSENATPKMVSYMMNSIDSFRISFTADFEGNIFDFANREIQAAKSESPTDKKKRGKPGPRYSTAKNVPGKPKQFSLQSKVEAYENVVIQMIDIFRDKIVQNIVGRMTRTLIAKTTNDKTVEVTEDDLKSAQTYLTRKKFIECVTKHLQMEIIHLDKREFFNALNLLPVDENSEERNLVNDKIKSVEFIAKLSPPKRKVYVFDAKQPKVFNIKWKLGKLEIDTNLHPELDLEYDKYNKVCFACGRTNMILQACETCNLINFCENGCHDNNFPSTKEAICGICHSPCFDPEVIETESLEAMANLYKRN